MGSTPATWTSGGQDNSLQAQAFSHASLGSSKLECTRALTESSTTLQLSVILRDILSAEGRGIRIVSSLCVVLRVGLCAEAEQMSQLFLKAARSC
jgi:hypothetical protein